MKLNLRRIRRKKKMSIRQLSIKAKVSRGYISELEWDIYENPSISIICRLSKALECTLDDLIDCGGGEEGDRKGI